MTNIEQIMKTMKNAEASINMEGLSVSEVQRELCFRLLCGEITFEEYLVAVKSALVTA